MRSKLPHKTARATHDGSRHKPVETVRLDERHQVALAVFFQEAWAAPPPPVDPAAPAFGMLVDGRMVGYIGTLPVRFWDGARDYPGHWMKGFMVLPEYRNSGVGFLVLKDAMRHLGIAGSLSVAPAARRLFTAVGFSEVGALSNQITLLRPWRVFSSFDPEALGLALPRFMIPMIRVGQRIGAFAFAGVALAAVLGLWRFALRLDTWRLHARCADPQATELDDLWLRIRAAMPAGVVRDAHHFSRYGNGYRFITLHQGSSLAGVAVVRLPASEGDPRLRGVRVAVLAELLADPSNRKVQRALLLAAETVARAAGADALLCSASHAGLRKLLGSQGYLPFPGNVFLLIHGLPENDRRPIGEWWLTRGDGHADEVF